MASRRSHTKSRNGCIECKRKRVKCDEQQPCFNCVRYKVQCTVVRKSLVVVRHDAAAAASPAALSPTPQSSSAGGDGSGGDSGGGRGGGRLEDALLPAEQQARDMRVAGSDFMDLDIISAPPVPASPTGTGTGTATPDLELMHHYCTSTCDTLARREDMRLVWRLVIPQEGYRHAFVMQGILAIAALHRAHLVPSQRRRWLDLSAYYETRGLGVFRSLLGRVTGANWRPVFCFASLVIAFVTALPVRSEGRRLPTPILSTLELFSLVRGIRSILAPWVGEIHRTTLGPLTQGVWRAEADHPDRAVPSVEDSLLPEDTFSALANLRCFAAARLEGSMLHDYAAALSALEDCARHMADAGLHLEIGTPLFWPYLIPESVLAGMQPKQSEPHCLVLLAYFGVFFTVLEDTCWQLRGWGSQLLADVEAHLAQRGETEFTALLKWPKSVESRWN
ncbi:hypothetical protein GGR56DRAFT_135788 [Xylariaceae sp. FL0804]|nr:hypothetical protein GGR56DRAFT_135788 [Xylariaceae sp. FL0804]